jgi:hypothetical protein
VKPDLGEQWMAGGGGAAVRARLSMRGKLGAIIRDPLLAFLLVGGGIFAAYHAIEARRKPVVHYTAQVESALVQDFETVSGRKANAADRVRLRKDYITDELLFHEAIDRGMHLTDAQTRKRLTDKVRYLVAGAPPEPREEQLVDYYSDHLDRYQAEPRLTFEQLFFAAAPADPAPILAQLERGVPVRGDDFWLGRDFPRYGESMVRGIFGQAFLDRLRTAPQGRWIGPVRSARGWHFVRRDESIGSSLLPYRDVRDQVRQDYMMAQTGRAIDGEIARLETRYDIQIDR